MNIEIVLRTNYSTTRAREAKAQGGVSSGSAVAAAGRAAAGRAAANDTPTLDKDVGMLCKDLVTNKLSAASKSELGVD